jgi:hypothetical protein
MEIEKRTFFKSLSKYLILAILEYMSPFDILIYRSLNKRILTLVKSDD